MVACLKSNRPPTIGTSMSKTVSTANAASQDRLAIRLSTEDRGAILVIANALAAKHPDAAPWSRVTVSECVRVALKAAAGAAQAGNLPI